MYVYFLYCVEKLSRYTFKILCTELPCCQHIEQVFAEVTHTRMVGQTFSGTVNVPLMLPSEASKAIPRATSFTTQRHIERLSRRFFVTLIQYLPVMENL
jgi:hypothetical protein